MAYYLTRSSKYVAPMRQVVAKKPTANCPLRLNLTNLLVRVFLVQ